MELQGYQLKSTLSQFGVFNLSMDVGGSGEFTQFAPAWTATITGFAMQNLFGFGAELLEGNLQKGPGESTVNGTGSLPGSLPRAEPAPGFSSLHAFAQGIKVPAKAPPRAMMDAALTGTDPLDQPMSASQTFMLLDLQEGSWADGRDGYIHAARLTVPDIADKYFGSGWSGSGPLGRRWTHLMLRTSVSQVNGTTQVGEVELFGKVYGLLPELT
jgi:hypothetical protein